MNNTVGEITKFFLNKNWAIFVLSIICGFFTSVAIIPAEWRDVIPFENKDWRVIAIIVIISLVFYLVFYLICTIWRKVSDRYYYSKLKKEKDDYSNEQAKMNVIHTIDCWNENDYRGLMKLITNGNKPIKKFLMSGSNIRPNWFKIVQDKETSKTKKQSERSSQEIRDPRAVIISLKPDIYAFLKQIYNEEGSLTSEYRPVFYFNEDSKEK